VTVERYEFMRRSAFRDRGFSSDGITRGHAMGCISIENRKQRLKRPF
jgi:hypothetical protein